MSLIILITGTVIINLLKSSFLSHVAEILNVYFPAKFRELYIEYLSKYYSGKNIENFVDGKLALVHVIAWCRQVPTFTCTTINSLKPRQNGRLFADDTFKRIFLNENIIIPIKISLKFVPKGPINYNPALVQIMAWRRSGDRPLSEPMKVSLLTHICVTRPQWVNRELRCHLTLVGHSKLKLCLWSMPLISPWPSFQSP